MELTREIIDDRVITNITDIGIRKTDEKDTIVCYCSDNPPYDDIERSVRGCIFDGNDLVIKSIPYSYETVVNHNLKIKENFEIEAFQNLKFYLAREGTTIRVFNHKDKWYCTTHRKIDAFRSKWGNTKSFGEIFAENVLSKCGKTLEEFYENLDKDLTYTFLTGTNQNTRIVEPVSDEINLFLCQKKKTGEVVQNENLKDWYQKNLQFESLVELKKYVETQFSSPFVNGHGIFCFDETNLLGYKFVNSKYSELTKLRNNLPSIPFAYLHNVFDKSKNVEFRKLYPEFEIKFDEYDKKIDQAISRVFNNYIKRYIYRQEILVPEQEHSVLYKLHGAYIKSKVKISPVVVKEFVKTVKPSVMNKLISDRIDKPKLEISVN